MAGHRPFSGAGVPPGVDVCRPASRPVAAKPGAEKNYGGKLDWILLMPNQRNLKLNYLGAGSSLDGVQLWTDEVE
jgi:hypothetical protein